MLVHLPIGLLIGNAIFTAIALRRDTPAYEQTAFHCLWLGLLLTLPAVLSGAWEAARQIFGSLAPRQDAVGWVNAHAIAGLAMCGCYWHAWQLRRRNPGILRDPALRRGYLAAIGGGAALLVASGWLGGELVYRLKLGM